MTQLGARLDVEELDALLESRPDLIVPLADTRIDDLLGIRAGGACPEELATAGDVDTCAAANQGVHHRQVHVGLDGVTDQVRATCKRLVDPVVGVKEGAGAVEIHRGADLGGDVRHRQPFGVETTVSPRERLEVGVTHSCSFLSLLRGR